MGVLALIFVRPSGLIGARSEAGYFDEAHHAISGPSGNVIQSQRLAFGFLSNSPLNMPLNRLGFGC